MEITLRDVLSELATDLRARNYDDRISYRYLNSKFKSKLDYFLRLESKSREFLKDYTLWKKIENFELEDYSPSACGLVDECKMLKRSVKELPEILSTSYGKLIKVFSGDDLKDYTFIKSVDYKDYINRPFIVNDRLFWISENRLIIPNINADFVSVYLIPKDDSEIDKLNNKLSPCSSSLDGTLSYPDYIITLAKQETLKEVMGGYVRMIEDEKGDDNSNSKN